MGEAGEAELLASFCPVFHCYIKATAMSKGLMIGLYQVVELVRTGFRPKQWPRHK